MNIRRFSTATFLLIVAVIVAMTASTAASATFKPGSKSLGDPIFPQIGNGGYDVRAYTVDLDYEPSSNEFLPGTETTIIAVATHGLSSFSLDFQRDLAISAVTVDGVPAADFKRAAAKPELSSDPEVTQPAKLTVTPATGIPKGSEFTVKVSYSGEPAVVVDTDGSLEGWVQACSSPGSCDGSFTVNEPIGAQSWFPSNNHPSDKATFEIRTTAPNAYTAIGAGVQTSRINNGDGTSTTTWVEDSPMASYLSTGTVGLFDVDDSQAMVDDADGATIPLFTAIDSAGSAQRKVDVTAGAARIPEMINFLSARFGAYPFDSVGLVADWVPSVGYTLENQTKPHFSGDDGGPAVDDGTLIHELAHMWMGDSISPKDWTVIWFNEGWATFSEVLFDFKVDGSDQSPQQFFRAVYAADRKPWKVPPAELNGDPSQLFNGFAVYARPGAMLQGLRKIIGNKAFFGLAEDLNGRHAYGNISRGEFVNEAKQASGLRGKKLKRLDRYFHQWLLWDKRPTLTPADFKD